MELQAFVEHFREAFPDLEGSSIVIALSGGADSTALLHLLNRAGLGLKLHATHVHHGTRGAEADGDVQFCRDLCQEYDIPFAMIRLAEDTLINRGQEASWREHRYQALERNALSIGASVIATAHHRDDVAEGVLLQMLRGAGPRAMAGIHARNGHIIRPLLPFSGSQIREWLVKENLAWREDSSNDNPRHLRNRVRHEVLPILETIAPSIRTHLIRLAHALADDEHCLALQLKNPNLWIDVWHPDGGISVDLIEEMPRALQIRWLHAQVARAGLPGATHRQCELLPDVLSGSEGALSLADRWRLRRSRGRLWLEPGPTMTPDSFQIDLEPGETPLPIPGWHVILRKAPPKISASRWIFPVPGTGPLTLRSPTPEDRLDDGRRPAAVLRDFLPRHLRRIWPILFGGDKLLWIPGVATDAPAAGGSRIVEVIHR